MYLDYTAPAGWTPAEVLGDLVGALTGAITTTAGLSASCDASRSELIATIPGGWSVHDAAAGSDAQCFKAPVSDDATRYKSVVLNLSATQLFLALYESWDAGTHAGTNLCADSNAPSGLNSANATRFILHSSARHIVIYAEHTAPATSISNGYPVVLTPGGVPGPLAIFERERIYAWDTSQADIPFGIWARLGDLMISNPYIYAKIPWFPAALNNGSASQAIQQNVRLMVPLEYDAAPAEGSYRTGISGQRSFCAVPILAWHDERGLIGNLTTKSNIWFAPRYTVMHHAEFTMDGKTWHALPGGDPQLSGTVGGMCLVPKE